ncbi:SRPBCC domain-containing protein [Pontibacter sp. JH31]|uniref:SRPBCC domain-containing protein n=1 Tax=Pontibacter aquaedesilientis TaxID=2766980 RepID=A0ABR7XJ22_9BACT|nr:SRPBCC domain-containing protein [Pontibacter aquaedesilientis]MBD1397633.1 SRPBCC domain-containing protein [Pontibacter aquaedesilientis]
MKKTENPIVVQQTYDASSEDVWKAITNPDEMQQWYFKEISSFEPKVGFETQFNVQVQDRIFPHSWKVTEVIPAKKVAYEWRYKGYSGTALVSFKVAEKANKSELALRFEVIEDFEEDIPEFKRESAVQGWGYFIQEALKNHLDGPGNS